MKYVYLDIQKLLSVIAGDPEQAYRLRKALDTVFEQPAPETTRVGYATTGNGPGYMSLFVGATDGRVWVDRSGDCVSLCVRVAKKGGR